MIKEELKEFIKQKYTSFQKKITFEAKAKYKIKFKNAQRIKK